MVKFLKKLKIKIIKINLLILLFSMMVLACNNQGNKADGSQDKIAAKNENPIKRSVVDSPCELVSLHEIKNMFVVEEYPIELKDVVYTYPTCIYKWEDGKVTTSRSFGGQEFKTAKPSEVLIVMVKKANEAMFKQSTSVYKQPQEISNLGAVAVWDSRMSQLTFLSSNYMFHVHVKVSNEDHDNKQKAIAVAQLIIGKI